MTSAPRARLWAYSAFGAILSGAGLPIYIFAPKFFADSYGVSLATLGAVLFALRLIDVVQDPVLGWLVERWRAIRGLTVALGAVLLGGAMVALFAVAPPIAPLWWFALSITVLFSAFSFLSITFYAQGIAKGRSIGSHTRLAGWREAGALAGVCLAAAAPTALGGVMAAPYAGFAMGYAVCVVLAAMAMTPEWSTTAAPSQGRIRDVLGDGQARWLLALALVNAMPLAVSSTLFLFFVESRLAAPGWEGPLLLLFFAAAAASAPGWSWAAGRFGTRATLLTAMFLAIAAFGGVLALGEGDIGWFVLICILSGATIGADLTLLPALFSARMAVVSPEGGQGFGLWTFANKLTLAVAAVTVLPALDAVGFSAGEPVGPEALTALSLMYGLVPCVLKIGAVAMIVSNSALGAPQGVTRG